jgi:hypothetical protein
VKLDDCEIPDLQIPDRGISLRDIHWLDLGQEQGFERLVRAIEHALPKSASALLDGQRHPTGVIDVGSLPDTTTPDDKEPQLRERGHVTTSEGGEQQPAGGTNTSKWLVRVAASVIMAVLVWWSAEEFRRPDQVSPGEPRERNLEGCVVTVTSNRQVTLRRGPSRLSREVEVVSVTPGQYRSSRYAIERFAGRDYGWFLINLDGRYGWIQDDTYTIAEKTSDCP